MKAKVTFKQILQDDQQLGSGEQWMVSRIFFDLEIDGRKIPGLYVDIKQTVGSPFETAPLEVGSPHEYAGPRNHAEFRKEAENIYRWSFGPEGRMIHVSGGGQFRMQGNIVGLKKTIEFEVSGSMNGW